jgi:hypothetical protein
MSQDLRYSRHALERMFQRGITPDIINCIVTEDNVIANYPDDQPYPSKLILGFANNRPIHIVIAIESGTGTRIVITVYQPDPLLWDETYSKRRVP